MANKSNNSNSSNNTATIFLNQFPTTAASTTSSSRRRSRWWLFVGCIAILCAVGFFSDRKLLLKVQNGSIPINSDTNKSASIISGSITSNTNTITQEKQLQHQIQQKHELQERQDAETVEDSTKKNVGTQPPTQSPTQPPSTQPPLTQPPSTPSSTLPPTAIPTTTKTEPTAEDTTNTDSIANSTTGEASTNTSSDAIGSNNNNSSNDTTTTKPSTVVSILNNETSMMTASPNVSSGDDNFGNEGNVTLKKESEILDNDHETEEEQQLQQMIQQKQTTLHPHPHAGARDTDGNYGYVANVTQLRDWMIQKYCTTTNNSKDTNNNIYNNLLLLPITCTMPFTSGREYYEVCDVDPKKGYEGVGWDIVSNIVSPIDERATLLLNPTDTETSNDDTIPTTNIPTVLCAIYTYDKKHDTSVRAVAETWGWRCDGFFAASTQTSTTFNMSNIQPQPDNDGANYYDGYEPPPVAMIDLVHQGDESYENMWQKTRSILSYMYDNYLNQFDYFYLSGDDTHLIVENLKYFLMNATAATATTANNADQSTQEQDTSTSTGTPNGTAIIFSGQIIKSGRGIYMGGGGGYVISRTALKRFVEDAIPNCHQHVRISAEDRFVTYCMNSIGIQVLDAVDPIEGKQRFIGLSPAWIAAGKGENGFFKMSIEYWASIHGYKSKSDLVSSTAIAFHLLKNVHEMKRHHAILYSKRLLLMQLLLASSSTSDINNNTLSSGTTICPPGTKIGDALLEILKKQLQQQQQATEGSSVVTQQ